MTNKLYVGFTKTIDPPAGGSLFIRPSRTVSIYWRTTCGIKPAINGGSEE
jgi:hypothetical protein